jgi:hypothetical protein
MQFLGITINSSFVQTIIFRANKDYPEDDIREKSSQHHYYLTFRKINLNNRSFFDKGDNMVFSKVQNSQ